MTDSPITVERNDAVVILTIDNPEGRNTLSGPVSDAIVDELDALGETATRGVLLRSDGETFCASGDVSAHVERVDGEITADQWRERMDSAAETVAALYECPLPTVAAIDGAAFSEGACLALACDIRLANPDGAIGFGFRRFGQTPTAGATYLLPRIVGPDVAAELLYTGKLLDAERASELGLFTSVTPHEQFSDTISSLLSELATGPAAGLQATKQLLRADNERLEDAIESEQRVQQRLAETADFREGVTAFREQRDPSFQ